MTRAPISTKLLCKAAERRGWILVRRMYLARFEDEELRVYRSPDNPKLLIVIEHSAWPLPESKRRKWLRLLRLTMKDLKGL